MRIQLIAAAACLVLGTSPATAQVGNQQSAAGTATSARPQAAAPEKKVCRAIEQTGSNRKERVCLTKKDWARVEAHIQNSF